MSSRATSLENLSADLYPIGGDSYRDFVKTTLNMYETGTLLYYTGDRLSAHANEFVFEENELSGIESWQQEAANYLCAFKVLGALPQLFGAVLASPNGITNTSPAANWPLSPFYGQMYFPFDKMYRGWTFQQFKGAWQNLMSQCATPSYQSQGWKIYSCPWLLSSSLINEANGSKGFTCMWPGFPAMASIEDYRSYGAIQGYMRGSWGLERGGIWGRLPGGNTQTLAVMSCNVPFAGGDSRVLTVCTARGSAGLFEDLSGLFQFFDPEDENVYVLWPRSYTLNELKENYNGLALFSGRMHFPLSDLKQNPNLSAKDGWIYPVEARDNQRAYIRGSQESIDGCCPSVHPAFKQWRALADSYFTHMQHNGETMRMASHPFNYSVHHNKMYDETTLEYSAYISIDNAMTKAVKRFTANVSHRHTDAREQSVPGNTIKIGRRQNSSHDPGTAVAVPIVGHYVLANHWYLGDVGSPRGIARADGLSPAEQQMADSLFPPTVWQQKTDDIISVQNLSSSLLLSAQQRLSAAQSEISTYYDDFFDAEQDAWSRACAPYGYLNDFDWSSIDKTQWLDIESTVWDYVRDKIAADPALPTDEEKDERMTEIEDAYESNMESNGGWDLYSTLWSLEQEINSLQWYIRDLPRQMQLSVNAISASTDYHVQIPDPSFLNQFLSKSWAGGGTLTAEGNGSYAAYISCISPDVSAWNNILYQTAFYNGTDVWPLPQLMHMKSERYAPLSVDDCIGTKWKMYASTSADLSASYVDGQNFLFNDFKYLSADEAYIDKVGQYAEIIARGSGLDSRSSLSGTRPSLASYVYNGSFEEELSVYEPHISTLIQVHATMDTCTYEYKEAAVLEIVLTPVAVGGPTTVTYANSQGGAILANYGAQVGASYPTPPPLSVLRYYEDSQLNPIDNIEVETYGTRYRAARMKLADIAY